MVKDCPGLNENHDKRALIDYIRFEAKPYSNSYQGRSYAVKSLK